MVTRKQFLEKHYTEVRKEFAETVQREKERIDDLIEKYKNEKSVGKQWGYAFLEIPFGTLRGLFNAAVDIGTTFVASSLNLANNFSHVLDDGDGTSKENDFKYMLADLGATFYEGLSSAGIGLVADVSSLFGANTEWAYGKDGKGGLIEYNAEKANQFRVNFLEGNGAKNYDLLFEKNEGWQKQELFSDDYTTPNERNKEKLEERWKKETPTGNLTTDVAQGFDSSHDYFRSNLYQDLLTFVDKAGWVKENIIGKATFKEELYERAGNTKFYEISNSVFENIGRLIPVMLMSYMGKNANIPPTQLKTMSSLYFGSSVYGMSFEEALNNGASMNDAHTYAFGNMTLELLTEEIGGFRPGQKMDTSSFRSVFNNMKEEAFEEMVAEFAGGGLSYYSNEDNEFEEKTTPELVERVAFASLVGALSGGVMSGGGAVLNLSTKSQLADFESILRSNIDTVGAKEATVQAQKIVKRLQKRLNSPSTSEATKQEILKNPFSKILFEKSSDDSQGYQLTEKGQKIMDGDILAKQGDTQISKDTHAVGANNPLVNHPQTVTVFDSKGKAISKPIKIVEKESIEGRKNSTIINEILDAGWNVAFVEVKGRNVYASDASFESFLDEDTGIIYVNIDSNKAVSNLIAHEIHDKISSLSRKGFLGKRQKSAWVKFLKKYVKIGNMAKEGTPTPLEKLGVKFDEIRYTREYMGRSDFEALMETERVSAFIQQAMNNKKILEKALKTDRNLFEKIASIFTNELSYKKMVKEMGLDSKKDKKLIQFMTKLQKSFSKAVQANIENIKSQNNMIRGYLQERSERLFSLDSDNATYEKTRKLLEMDPSTLEYKLSFDFESAFEKENIHLFVDLIEDSVLMIPRSKPKVEIISEENNKELYDQGYFLKVEGMFFNKEDFRIHESALVERLIYVESENQFFYSLFPKNESEGMTRDNLDFNKDIAVYPRLQIEKGFLKNPIFFEMSLRNHQLKVLFEKGFLPSQSVNLSNVSGRDFSTREFGHVTAILKKDITKKTDFFVTKKDVFSRLRSLEKIYDNIIILKENFPEVGVSAEESFDIHDKMGIFRANLKHIKTQYKAEWLDRALYRIQEKESRGEASAGEYSVLISNLNTLLVDVKNPKKSQSRLKSEIEKARDSKKTDDIFKAFRNAVESFKKILGKDIDLYEISTIMNFLDNENEPQKPFLRRDFFDDMRMNKKDFLNIKKFMDMYDYSIISEGVMEIELSDIEAFVINPTVVSYGYSNNRVTNEERTKVLEETEKILRDISSKHGIKIIKTPLKTFSTNDSKLKSMEELVINNKNKRNVSFSLDSDFSKTLQKITIKSMIKNIESTGFKFLRNSKRQIVDEMGNKLTKTDIHLLEYVLTTPPGEFDFRYVYLHPAYQKIKNISNEIEAKFMEKHNIDLPRTYDVQNNEELDDMRSVALRKHLQNAQKRNPKKGKKLAIVVGLPGGGKSSRLADVIALHYDAFVSDSDDIKALMPGYNGYNANLYHKDSKELNIMALKVMFRKGSNVVLPIVGAEGDQVLGYAQMAKEAGYSVELYLNDVSMNTSIARTTSRVLFNKRYIPMELLLGYKDFPKKTFNEIKGDEIFDGHYEQSNEVDYGKRPIIKESFGIDGPLETITRELEKLPEHVESTQGEPTVRGDVDEGNTSENDGRLGREVASEGRTQQDFLSQEERTQIEETLTARSNANGSLYTFAGNMGVSQFASTIGNRVGIDTYEYFEDAFERLQEEIKKRVKKPKKPLDKLVSSMYKGWIDYIKKIRTDNQVYNHMGSIAAKTIVAEMNTLAKLIETDKQRADKKPTNAELKKIVEELNKNIYGALDYLDKELQVEINISEENPKGFLYTRAIYWYFRDVLKQEVWDDNAIQAFENDFRGFAYRRLVNAILGINKKGGTQELLFAMRQFSSATNVEPIMDLALDDSQPRTRENIKKQWENNTSNIILIRDVIGYKFKINSLLDMFTVGEMAGLYNKNSWSMVLNDKIVRGNDRKLSIERHYREKFEKNNWLKKNYKRIVALDKNETAVNVENLGNKRVNRSQVMYLRNMLLREIVRNRAIDLGMMKGEKTSHFNKGNKIDILKITEYRTEKQDGKTVGEVKDTLELLKELEEIINNDEFMVEYNQKVIELFNEMYPFVNERYKEINGLNLSNDSLQIQKGFSRTDPQISKKIFLGLPKTITRDTLDGLYIPFLLDNSSYFDKKKMNFKSIIDLGVFDGMTQELTDNDGIISVDSITNVMSSYVREVGNFYGLHRIMRDLNIVLNETLSGYGQTTYINRNIEKSLIKFYVDMLNDMAGYKPPAKNPALNKSLSWFRRNFYRASLGVNLKVIGSQVTTMFNLSNLYGPKFKDMFPLMLKNFFAQHTEANKALVKELDETNNVYWDRKTNTTFEIGEATSEGFVKNNSFNRTMQKLMYGIRFTDASINRALYLTLLELGYSKEKASETVRDAILRSQSSPLAVAKAPLLRTDNEVFRVMLKFLGEPMKLITQSYNSLQ